MPHKTVLDISSENFDYFFAKEVEKITPQQKEALPRDISYRMYKGGAKFRSASTSRFNIMQKIFILWKCLKKRWYIVVEDEENGMSEGEFLQFRKSLKKSEYSIDKAGTFTAPGHFILANKELCDAFSYANRLSNSPAYNYLIRGKNKIVNPAAEWSKRMKYIVQFILTYESNKKSWCSEYKIEMPEFYVLITLYHGEEMKSSPIHQKIFRRAYQSSQTKIRKSFSVLQAKGLIEKTSDTKGTKLRITPLGTDMVNNILEKYALNF